MFQRAPALAKKVRVQHALHDAVDVVGEPANVEALDEPRRLHQQRDGDIGKHQHDHVRGGVASAENIGQTLRQPAFNPGARQQTAVIQQAENGGEKNGQPFLTEVRKDAIRAVILWLHGFAPPAAV